MYAADLITSGQPAPDFTASTTDGDIVTLSHFQSIQRVVLVFYPGDFTPVCTAQLCQLRDCWKKISQEDTMVFGINPAPILVHKLFAYIKHLPFPLLSDPSGDIAKSYHSRSAFGSIRTVYLIDGDGIVVDSWRGKPAPDLILAQIRTLHDSISQKNDNRACQTES